MDINSFIFNNYLKILVKTNSKKNKIIGYDKEKDAVRVEIKAPAENNKANIEIVKYFSRLLKKKVRIKSGLKSKIKLLVIDK